MRVLQLLAVPASLVFSVSISPPIAHADYAEHLHLKPLPGGTVYAGFNFTTSTLLSAYDSQNFRFFPRSLGQILQYTHTSELHLRFALGRWDEDNWGTRPREGAREGGTGVELWAWLEAASKNEAKERWSSLVNSLSGLFCASLNFIEQTKTIQPILTFEPESNRESSSPLHLMHGMLPHEVVCTENLTPFLKLLPCKGKAGIASLLDGHKIFDASWQTMAIDVRQRCDADERCFLEIEQTVDMVLDLERCMRQRDDPIPRPPPIESVACNESKPYSARDTCYPQHSDDKTGWTLAQIFGTSIKGSCPIGNSSTAPEIVLETSPKSSVELLFPHGADQSWNNAQGLSYRLSSGHQFDFQVRDDRAAQLYADVSLIRASRQITGYGQERGAMHTVITNPSSQSRQIVYMETLPWFLRPFVHTLDVKGGNIKQMFYAPALDRHKGTHLELLLDIPAMSTVELTYDFEKAILRYTEYPPDANRGFDVAPAVVRILPVVGEFKAQGGYLRTTSLLLPLSTPDFSMPYNVIILTSTVIALGFGSIFNLLIRRFVFLTNVPPTPFAVFIGNAARIVKGKLVRVGWDSTIIAGKHATAPTSAVSLMVEAGSKEQKASHNDGRVHQTYSSASAPN